MKKLISAFIVLTIILSCASTALASSSSLGMTTGELFVMFNNCLDEMESLGLWHYHLELSAKDKDRPSVVSPLTQHCSIEVKQENGTVKSFKIVSDEKKDDSTSDTRLAEIYICFMAAMLLTNDIFTEDNAMEYLSEVLGDNQEHTYGDVTYRFVTTQPFSTIVGLEVTPAEK